MISPYFIHPQENEIAEPGPFTKSAIIASEYPENRFEVYDTSFENNEYNDPTIQVSHSKFALLKLFYRLLFHSLTQTLCSPPPQGLGAAIEAVGPVIIKNCCFLDNEFLRYAPVVLIEQFATLTASGNFGNVIGDPDLKCDFAISFDNVLDYENLENFRCIEFDANECNIAPRITTPPEMGAPTQAPSRRPSRFEPTASPATAAPTGSGADGRSIMFLSTAVAAVAVYFAL